MSRLGFLVVASSACVNSPEPISSHAQEAGNTAPWKQPAKWPYQIESPNFIVHYQATGDRAMAQTVFSAVDHAWQVQVGQGARPPLADRAVAGPDDRFDVYLQRGIDTLYVSSLAANTATTWDDYSSVMVLDPWGQYGGAELVPNVFHEFRHASQAVDDWFEHPHIFEAEATLWETAYYGYDRLGVVWADYQAHPEWTPFKNDRYATWYMYGGALFLLHLQKNVFGGSLQFSNDMWLGSRNPAGTNEPDFADALAPILAAKNTNLFDQITKFARNRWYTGARANGIVDGGPAIAEVASKPHVRAANATRTSFVANPEVLGTNYTVVQAASTDGATLRISLSNIDAKAKPIVQVVGQGANDRVLDFSTGSATVDVVNGSVVLAVTMQPSNGQFDPDTVGTQLYKATINIDR